MTAGVVRPSKGRLPQRRSLTPVNWGMLLLFMLFTAAIGVREAKAQPEFTIASCALACSGAFRSLKSTTFCGGCLIWAGRSLRRYWLGNDDIAGYGCAKANVDC